MNKKWAGFTLVMVLAVGGLWGAESSPQPKTTPVAMKLDDKFINQQEAQLDKSSKLIADMSSKLSARPKDPHVDISLQRLAFEQKEITERRAFLESLKPMKEESRLAAWRQFEVKQGLERKNFNESMKVKIQALNKETASKQPPPKPSATPKK